MEDTREIEVSDSVYDNVPEGVEFERSWADLPDLVLYNISVCLVMDRYRIIFSLVCKSWNYISQSPIQTKQRLQLNTIECSYPHLLFTDNELIHPTLENKYQLKKFPEGILCVKLCAVKNDWMLYTQNKCSPAYTYAMSSKAVFFFNPFTRAKVWLPNLLGGRDFSMCFTSPPTSADFKVVVVRSSQPRLWKEITIDTIKCGENRWSSTKFEFREDSLFKFSYCTPVIYKGMCYILDKESTLLIHNPKKNTFFLHKSPDSLYSKVQEQYLLESDGKLLANFVEKSGSWVLVCRWNVSKRKWDKLECLENEVLFVSRPYSLSIKVGASELRNRIYFPRLVDDHCLFYSLNTRRFHTSDGSSFTSFHGSASAFSSTWIKPSCINY